MAEKKRKDYISWEELYMGIAALAAHRSKDPSTQIGSVITDKEGRLIGLGYNGFPHGCSDDVLPWSGEDKSILKVKNTFVVNSEINALMHATSRVEGARMYTIMFPDNESAKAIIQSGIKEVLYLIENHHKEKAEASKRMFNMAGVKVRKYEPRHTKIEIDFKSFQ